MAKTKANRRAGWARSERVESAVKPNEKTRMERAAEVVSLPLAAWMRSRLIEAADRELAPPFETAGRPVEPRTVPGEGEPR